MHERKVHGQEGLDLAARLIEINPDYYTLWNYRRECLRTLWGGECAAERKSELAQGELQLTVAALKRNPKSYCAWSHRLWLLDERVADAAAELELCAAFLSKDARNFHCWDYRAAVRRRLGAAATVEDELAFTLAKINESFSNYSAWHYRSVAVAQILARPSAAGDAAAAAAAAERARLLDAEFDSVKQAFFTDPRDQSAWLYHRWLLWQCGDGERRVAVLRRELDVCAELLALEPECKWALLAREYLLRALRACGAMAADEAARLAIEAVDRLATLDPMRVNVYRALRSSWTPAAAAAAAPKAAAS
jgi:geranylgeranyl transferase type-2 subunit alpha